MKHLSVSECSIVYGPHIAITTGCSIITERSHCRCMGNHQGREEFAASPCCPPSLGPALIICDGAVSMKSTLVTSSEESCSPSRDHANPGTSEATSWRKILTAIILCKHIAPIEGICSNSSSKGPLLALTLLSGLLQTPRRSARPTVLHARIRLVRADLPALRQKSSLGVR